MASSKSSRPAPTPDKEVMAAQDRSATIIGVVVTLVVVLALVAGIGFATGWRITRPGSTKADGRQGLRDARTAVIAVKNVPEAASTEGGFTLSKDGLDKPVKGVPTVAVYMDFLCPACGELDRKLAPAWESMMEAGQINLELHPNGFLDPLSGGDEYSTRSAAAWAWIAQHDPRHALTFTQALYDQSFQPEEGSRYHKVSDEDLVGQAVKAGVDRATAERAVKGDYTEWIRALAKYTPMRPSLQHPSGELKGEMTTPTMTINGHYWDFSTVASDEALPGALAHAIDLPEAQIGSAKVRPGLQDTGAPRR